MFRASIILLFSIVTLSSFAQQMATREVPILKDYPYFNNEFIQERKIKKCSTEVMYKIPNRKLRKSKESVTYEFDVAGHVSKIKSVNKLGSDYSVSYHLNKHGKLASMHKRSAYENMLTTFFYNVEGFLTSEEVVNATTGNRIERNNFKYEQYSNYQYKKFFLNNEDLTYKYQIVDLDEKGRKVETNARFIRGVNRSYELFKYENDLLIQYSQNTKEVTRREERYDMKYDESGLLQVTEMSVDGALTFHYEFLYKDGLLSAILRKEIKTQEIQITKFKYSFY